ncbi:zinc-dependent alcohol dehydrogenase [Sphingobium cloacae]|uniref:Alcohol dehydrogenase n=1 Tax=Sphingobium cloacae TaxID=120107 RepID=A0A1E1EXR0_9SPHN|nr:zinc-binding dehydrogenase [Sphingobium cloacae]BAV63058.1 hypothetical protein SCLO_1000180 [Sphingobium cloacae]
MTEFARAVVFTAPETFEIQDIPIAEVGPDDMFVAVELGGVDGSELHMFKGELPWFNSRAPIVFGDEIVGRVHSIGMAAAARRGLAVGDRVTIEARWPCNDCRYCASGQYYLCSRNVDGRGYGTITAREMPSLWGGYATHVYVPKEALVYAVPEDLPAKTALVACSTLANGLTWSGVAGAGAGKVIAIIGPGPQGIGCALASVQAGAQVIVIGLAKDRERLAFVERYGAKTLAIAEGESHIDLAKRIRHVFGEIDAVIEAAGYQPAKDLALELVRPTGTIVHVSIPTPIEQPLDWMKMLFKEITLRCPVSHPNMVPTAIALAHDMFKNGVDIGEFISHVFPLERAEDAIHAASYRGDEVPIKVALDPQMRV